MNEYEVSVSEISENRREVGVIIARPTFDKKLNAAVQSLATKVELKGFRKGKAPVALVKKLYGDQIKADVIEDIWRDAFQDVVTNRALEVVGVSRFRLHDEEGSAELKIEAEFALLPRPVFAKLDGLEISVETEKFNENLVEEAIQELRRRAAEVEEVTDRDVAVEGDLLNISYEILIDGKTHGGDDDSHVEIGSGRSLKDLEAGLIGAKLGEQREVSVTFPGDYGDQSLAGKSATYKVSVKRLQRMNLPEMTDDFVKEYLGEESLASFRESLTKRIKRRLDERNHSAQVDAVVKAIYDANPFEIPELMIDEQIRFKLKELGVEKQDDYSRRDVSQLRPFLGEIATQELIKVIVLERLVEQLEIKPDDEQVERWVEDQANRYEVEKSEILAEFGAKRDRRRIKDVVAREAAIEQIVGRSKVIEQPKG
jgi:trigger factor